MTRMNDIDSLSNLPIGWDGYGGLPIKQSVIDKAMTNKGEQNG